ncbi:Crp/Fnr family transcriptional regulator [Roseateles sp. SL47]|uniref:Crp/Fnr family transcriptional regulator n=1 Tax=Roseateles sp. SL47 TaxID=2995138 RepID=UPI0022706795|nr:Crp/Fnr family transcriptional regulator [Roseateles sp. SL47]WAC75882.1 Crp/Fnr family transcriptional regulator [Roseateles sp. SL47]
MSFATTTATVPRSNDLLAQWPQEEMARVLPHLEAVELLKGRVLFDAGTPTHHVFFPANSIVSLIYTTHSGASSQVAMIGPEGVVGVSSLLGGESAAARAVVLRAGLAYRLRLNVLKDEFLRSGLVAHSLLRYVQSLMTQMAQTAVCNRHHSLERQLCRWLLQVLDRQHGHAELSVTQELIANMLGVRREGVTEGAQRLQAAGLIRYTRGHIAVLDRPGLETRACECYALLKPDFQRLMPQAVTETHATTSAAFAPVAVQA